MRHIGNILEYSKGSKNNSSGRTNVSLHPTFSGAIKLSSHTIIAPCHRCPILERSVFAAGAMVTNAVSKGANKQIVTNFNQKSYNSWSQARKAYRAVNGNAKVTSTWNHVFLVAEDIYPKLAKVGLRLVAAYSTSASSECNWTLWGHVYTSAQTALGLEHPEKLIMSNRLLPCC